MSRIARTLAPISGALGVVFLTLAILLAPQHRLLAQGVEPNCDGPTACSSNDCFTKPCSGTTEDCPNTAGCTDCICTEDDEETACECNIPQP